MRAHSTLLVVIAAFAFLTGTSEAQRRGAGVQTSFTTEKPIRRPVKLTAAMLGQIAKAVPDLARECDGDIAGNVSASRIRLNADGPPDLLLQGTSSCTMGAHTSGYWLLTRTAGGYKLAFNEYEDALSILPAVTRGYHDLMVADISGAGARVSETLLKYDRSKYKPASCWLTDQSKNGTRHRVPCGD
jgi:hypothetical protein